MSTFLCYFLIDTGPNFFFCFFVFLTYNDVYSEYTQRYIKWQSKHLYLEFVIDNLGINKTVIIQRNIKRKNICYFLDLN